jgi:hypothetical protein
MGLFVRNNSIAVTWTPNSCHAVRMGVSGKDCTVTQSWHGILGKDGDSVAELVLNALRALQADDSIFIVAGGQGQGWGMADIKAPALRQEDLRNALAFELRKQTPLPLDQLRWGYRILPVEDKKNQRKHVRLFFIKNDYWTSWMKAIDGLHHLDAIMPAPVALDPILNGQNLTILDNIAYEYRTSPQGRVVTPLADGAQVTFDQAFPMKNFTLGKLSTLSEEEKLAFVPAITLGVYALTESVSTDAKTLIPLPERFVAHRNIALKAIALCMAIYLIGLVVYTAAGNLSVKAAQIRQIDLAIQQTRAELDKISRLLDPKDQEKAKLIQDELVANTPTGPDFPTALLAITQAVKAPAWVAQSLEWKNGSISFQVQGPQKDLELANRLEASPYLGDVSERMSTYNQDSNNHTQRFELLARFDTPVEEEALKVQQRKEAERLAAERRQAKAEEETEEDLEDEIDDTEELEDEDPPEPPEAP